jgi:hypothetical protein
MYVHLVFMLHVSAAQGHLQATHFLRSLLHCALGQIILLRHVIIVIINFDAVGCFSSYLLYCSRLCVPLGVSFTWLYLVLLCVPCTGFGVVVLA